MQPWAEDKTVLVWNVLEGEKEKKKSGNTACQQAHMKSAITETTQAYVNQSFEKTAL